MTIYSKMALYHQPIGLDVTDIYTNSSNQSDRWCSIGDAVELRKKHGRSLQARHPRKRSRTS
jgi:hypothetical protein